LLTASLTAYTIASTSSSGAAEELQVGEVHDDLPVPGTDQSVEDRCEGVGGAPVELDAARRGGDPPGPVAPARRRRADAAEIGPVAPGA
jgi:hypothetical protein